ncbi:unnamed protein product [Symbiodinium sp. CCMP2592]|nr:unnamed protein product [Symbiodinium sp. CCMP2592]
MAEVNSREALLQAGVSEAQVEDVLQNLQSQQLVLAPAPDPPEWFSTVLWSDSVVSALSKKQLEEMKGACSLSESAFDALSDIVERGFQLPRCLSIGATASLLLFPLCLFIMLSDNVWVYQSAEVGALTSPVLFLFLSLYWECARSRAFALVLKDLNGHFRGHASNLSFLIEGRERGGYRLVVRSETRADGSV